MSNDTRKMFEKYPYNICEECQKKLDETYFSSSSYKKDNSELQTKDELKHDNKETSDADKVMVKEEQCNFSEEDKKELQCKEEECGDGSEQCVKSKPESCVKEENKNEEQPTKKRRISESNGGKRKQKTKKNVKK